MNIFNKSKKALLQIERLPKHIGFILDGNGRWATKKGLPRTMGHAYGVEAVANTIQNCMDLGIKYMSFYAFSTENWKRPQDEIDTIFNLLRDYIKKDRQKYEDKNVKLLASGDLDRLPEDIAAEIRKGIEQTKDNTGFVVNIAINYGGRDEIVRAINHLIEKGVKEVDKEIFKQFLYTKDLPDPDLIIRTSGEVRTSNFMPYQAAYAEWYFTKTLWPDFNKNRLIEALLNYQSRDRRFGAIKKGETK